MDFCNISTLGKRGYAFFFPFEPLPDVLLDMLPPLRVSAMTIPTSATDCVGDGVGTASCSILVRFALRPSFHKINIIFVVTKIFSSLR